MVRLGIIDENSSYRNHLKRVLSTSTDVSVYFNQPTIKNYDYCNQISILLLAISEDFDLTKLTTLKEGYPQLDIIVMTDSQSEEFILSTIYAGACSFFSKRATKQEILRSIELVNKGGSYLTPSLARSLINRLNKDKPTDLSSVLTPRQQQIIELIVKGNTYKEISQVLYISIETVRTHIKKIYKSLHVKNKAEAITKYLRMQNEII